MNFRGQVENDNFLVGNRVRIWRTGWHILDWIPFKDAPVKHSPNADRFSSLHRFLFTSDLIAILVFPRLFSAFFLLITLYFFFVCFIVFDASRRIDLDFRAAWNSFTKPVNVKIDSRWAEKHLIKSFKSGFFREKYQKLWLIFGLVFLRARSNAVASLFSIISFVVIVV